MNRIWFPQAVACAVLIWGVYPRNPYAYYVLLRWTCCGIFAYLTARALLKRMKGWSWVLGIAAVVYNPIRPVRIEREIWSVMAIATVPIVLLSIPGMARQRFSRFERMIVWSPVVLGCSSAVLFALVTSPDLESRATGQILLLACLVGLWMTAVTALGLPLVGRYPAAALIAGTTLCGLTAAFALSLGVSWYRHGVLIPKGGILSSGTWECRVPAAKSSLECIGGHFAAREAHLSVGGEVDPRVRVVLKNMSPWGGLHIMGGAIPAEHAKKVSPAVWIRVPREMAGVTVCGDIQATLTCPERVGKTGSYWVRAERFTQEVSVAVPTEQDFLNWEKAMVEYPGRVKPIAVLLVMGPLWFLATVRAYFQQ